MIPSLCFTKFSCLTRSQSQPQVPRPLWYLSVQNSQPHRVDFSQILGLGIYWSKRKRKRAFRPQGATIDAQRSHFLLESLGMAAILWRGVCSRKKRWSRVSTRARPSGCCRFFYICCVDFCASLEHQFFKRQNIDKNQRKICAKILALKFYVLKICTKNQHKKHTEKSVWKPFSLRKMNARKITKNNQRKLVQNPTANKICTYTSQAVSELMLSKFAFALANPVGI